MIKNGEKQVSPELSVHMLQVYLQLSMQIENKRGGGLNYTSNNNMYRDLNVFNEVGCIFK